jgi:plasmid stabilization system protein ParE
MSPRSLRLLPAAEFDANEAFDWYESEQSGLGDEFRAELKSSLRRILPGPSQFAIIHFPDIRRARLHRFPYSIIFKPEVGELLVVAIFHERRNPIIWRGRID